MVLKADQQRVKALLSETITLLCKNGLNFKREFSIEGLIGITLDQEEIFLVSIKETICSGLADAAAAVATPADQSSARLSGAATQSRRKRDRMEVDVKQRSSPAPAVANVSQDAGTGFDGATQGGGSESQAPPEDQSVGTITRTKRESPGDDAGTSAAGTAGANLNLTFSDIPIPDVGGDISAAALQRQDDGGGPPSSKRQRSSGARQGGWAPSAAAGSAAASTDSSGMDVFQSTLGGEEAEGNESSRGGRAKREHSDVIEIKDEFLSEGEEEGGGEEGEEGGYDYDPDYVAAMYGGDGSGVGDGGEMYAQGEGMMGGGGQMGGGGAGPSRGGFRRRSAPQGNGGGGQKQDPGRFSLPRYGQEQSEYPLEFVASQKGHYLLIADGFTSVKEKISCGKVFWKCAEHHHKLKCRARCCIQDSTIFVKSGHNHPPDMAKLENRQRFFCANVVELIQAIFPGEDCEMILSQV